MDDNIRVKRDGGKLIVLTVQVPRASAWVDLMPEDAEQLVELLQEAIKGDVDGRVKLGPEF